MGKIYSKLFIDVQDVKILSDLGCVMEYPHIHGGQVFVNAAVTGDTGGGGALSTSSTNAHHFLEVLWAHMADTRGSAFFRASKPDLIGGHWVKPIYPASRI